MSLPKLSILTLMITMAGSYCQAQSDAPSGVNKSFGSIVNLPSDKFSDKNKKFADSLQQRLWDEGKSTTRTDSGIIVYETAAGNCKNLLTGFSFIPFSGEDGQIVKVPQRPADKVKLLTIHGTVSYDFFYRSAIDTPVAQSNFQQHTERVQLDIVYKEKYPVRLNFSSRQSNSPFFRNFLDLNLGFDRYSYTKNLKQQLIGRANRLAVNKPDLGLLEDAIAKEKDKLEQLKLQNSGPIALQRIIEQRERQLVQSQRKPATALQDSALAEITENFSGNTSPPFAGSKLWDKLYPVKKSADSARQDAMLAYENNRQKIDSLQKNIQQLQKKADSIKYNLVKEGAALKQKIYGASNEKDLLKLARKEGLPTDSMSRMEKILTSVKSFSIGRSMLDYTELTAQNIIITGVNVEYNPSYYVAFAAGKIDYRFRDFFNKRTVSNNQYLVLGRLGVGDKDKRSLIFSFFKGRKSQSDFALSDSIKNYVNIVGYSVEAVIKKDAENFLSAEFAKSTKPLIGNLQTDKQTAVLFKLSDRDNMGVNFKAQAYIPETDTRLSGFFRKTGKDFQSFSLFSYSTSQVAWLAKAEQQLFKNKVGLTAMLRQNDFSNPFTERTYKTTTVFKSLLLNVRIPRYPSLSIGYYPGTQLYFINKDRIRENAYYIVNGSLVYNYNLHGTGFNSAFIYNRYINQATDSGFQLYKGVNYYLTQSVFFKKLQLQGAYAYSRQPLLQYYTLEASVDYALRKWLRVGAGVKYNDITGGENYIGQRMQLSADLKKIGVFQFQYEKSFLPAINSTLYTVEIGRVSWYKYF